jgi:hypothetical protein
MAVDFPGVPPFTGNLPSWVQRAYEVINNLLRGKMNVSALVTLTAGVTTTTITDARIGSETHIIFTPTTANAAAALATTYVSETNRVNGSVDITHANAGTTDRTFRISMIG